MMGGNRIETVPINKNRLKELLRARGLSNSQAAVNMGYSPSYFTNIMARGRIGKPAVVMLERMYNINPDEYVVSDGASKEPETADPEGLYKVVYDATYKAMKMALKETLYENVKLAVRDGWMSI